MKNRNTLLLILCLICVLCCAVALTACINNNTKTTAPNYSEGDAIIDDKDMEFIYFDSDSGYGYSYVGKQYEVKYLVKDGSKSYVTLEGEDTNNLIVTGVKGSITNLSLKEIEEAVTIDNKSISIVGIGEEAFKGNLTLTTVDLTKANPSLEFTIEDNAFRGCISLETVTLPGQIYTSVGNKIGEYAFANCSALTNITFADSLNDIGMGAFYSCQSLTSITLPDSVSVIRTGTFAMCDSLTQFSGAKSVRSIQSAAFSGTALSSIDFSSFTDLVYIGTNAFYGTKLSSVNIPNGVTYIGSGAFGNTENLQQVNIPFLGYSVANSYGWSFDTVYGMTSQQDSYTRSISVTVNATPSLLSGAFKNSAEVTSVTVNSLLDNGNYNVYGDDGTTYTRVEVISSNNIPGEAFYGCENLQSVSLPTGFESIGDRAFYNCKRLGSLTLPSSLTSIGSQAFYNCATLTSLTLPSNLETIGNYAFYGCHSLTEITLPSNLDVIGNAILGDCINLSKITIEKYNWVTDPEVTGSANYASAPLSNLFSSYSSVMSELDDLYYAPLYSANGVYVPYSLHEVSLGNVNALAASAFRGWKSLRTVSLSFRSWALIDGSTEVEFAIGNYAFYDCENLNTVTVNNNGDNVTSIGASAFYNCYKLEEVPEFEALEQVGSYAFYGCHSITEFTLPEKVTIIGSAILGDCISLTKLTIESYNYYNGNLQTVNVSNLFSANSEYYSDYPYTDRLYTANNYYVPTSLASVIYSNVIQLANNAFYGWRSLTKAELNFRYYAYDSYSIGSYAFYNCSNLQSIVLDKVSVIDTYAFSGCSSLEYIVLPSQLYTVNSYAFSNCTRLTTVYYCGSNWSNVSVYNGNTALTNATVLVQNSTNCVHNDNEWRWDDDGNISTELTVGDLEVVTEPTCTEPGQNRTICTVCNQEFIYVVPALGHDISDVSDNTQPNCEEPGYEHGLCSRCQEQIDNEIPALGHELGNNGYCTRCDKHLVHTVSSNGKCTECDQVLPYSVSQSSSYPFQYNDGVWTSSNQNKDNSTSYFTITATDTITITFRYKVSSESNYDKLSIQKNGSDVISAISGSTNYVTYTITLNAGDTLSFQYTKDSSQKNNDDTAYIADLVISEVQE